MTEPNAQQSASTTPPAAGPAPQAAPPPASPAPSEKDARLWATFCHLAAFAGVLGGPAAGLLNIVGPLVIWLIKKDQYDLVNDQGKEALNFQITISIGFLICIGLCLTVILAVIGIPLMFALGIADLVFVIIAAIKANNGERYRYPFALRFVK